MNIQCLPLFKRVNAQHKYNVLCSDSGENLISPNNFFLPFFYQRLRSNSKPKTIDLYRASDNTKIQTIPISLSVYSNNIYDYVVYKSAVFENDYKLPCGLHYFKIEDMYSEVFNVVNNISEYIKIQWRQKEGGNVDNTFYASGFYNTIYLDAVISTPSYKFDEEGIEDYKGRFRQNRANLSKVYNFDTKMLPEFLVDLLNSIQVHNEVIIGSFSDINSFVVDVKNNWDSKGCSASVNINFSAGDPLTSDCCNNENNFTEVNFDWVDTEEGEYCAIDNNGNNTGFVVVKQINTVTNEEREIEVRKDLAMCPLPTIFYRSAKIEEVVYPTVFSCPEGEEPQPVTFTVEEGAFIDSTQEKADEKARIYFSENKEKYANDNYFCSVIQDNFYECNLDEMYCFTGSMIHRVSGNIRTATLEECVSCKKNNNLQNCLDVACF